jgi:hypothetical protein
MTSAAQPAATPAELTAGLSQAFELIAVLRGQIDAILDELQARRPTSDAHVVNWAALDSDAARRTWHQLYQWATWLLDRYAIREIPRACWWRHGLIVEEVTALWTAWQGCYGEDSTPNAPIFWHEHLDRARERIRLRLQQQGNCTAAGHQPIALQPHPSHVFTDFTAFVTADAAGRTTPPQPGSQPEPTS